MKSTFIEVDYSQKRGGLMEKEIKITKKIARRGDDGYRVVSVRMKYETIERLDEISAKTNRSRNELINILIQSAMEIVKIEF